MVQLSIRRKCRRRLPRHAAPLHAIFDPY